MKRLLVVFFFAFATVVSSVEAGKPPQVTTEADCARVKKLQAKNSGGWVKDPQLWIRVITTCPNKEVRTSAAIDLSHWITDNGQETCTGLKEIESNLVPLLTALRDGSTAQYLVEVLGGRWSGDKPLPCCMSQANKLRVVSALEGLLRDPPREPRYWSDALPNEALLHISQCVP